MCYPVCVMVYFAKGGLLNNVDAVFSFIVLCVMVWYRCYIFSFYPVFTSISRKTTGVYVLSCMCDGVFR